MKIKHFLVIIILAGIAFTMTGCDIEPSNNDKAVDACIKKGGVPLLARSQGTLVLGDCKFNDNVKQNDRGY